MNYGGEPVSIVLDYHDAGDELCFEDQLMRPQRSGGAAIKRFELSCRDQNRNTLGVCSIGPANELTESQHGLFSENFQNISGAKKTPTC
jgi:hypothetical protein